MEYRCNATSLEGFIQQLAVSYVGRGYWHYVTGKIADGKDAELVAAHLCQAVHLVCEGRARVHRLETARTLRTNCYLYICYQLPSHQHTCAVYLSNSPIL